MLSAIIVTKDAEATIQRTLRSVAFADEQIVIVDAATRDQTAARASQAGALVITHPWQGYGPQKNFGASRAKGEWLLFIDDDEEVTPELQQQITRTMANPTKDFYWLHIVTIFLGKPLRHLYGHNSRLFKKAAGHWTNTRVHEQVVSLDNAPIKLGDTKSEMLTTPLLHHSHPTIHSYLQKMHHYTTLDAEQMRRSRQHRSGRPVKPTLLLPFYLATRQFIKLYVYRHGFLDGYAGLIWCVLSAYYEYEMGSKYRKL